MAHSLTSDHVEHDGCNIDRQADMQVGDKEPTNNQSIIIGYLRNDFLESPLPDRYGALIVGQNQSVQLYEDVQ